MEYLKVFMAAEKTSHGGSEWSNDDILRALSYLREKYHSQVLSGIASELDNIRPGYLIVTGFDPENRTHYLNLVDGNRHQLVGRGLNGDTGAVLEKLVAQDEAIVIDQSGRIERVGARLRNYVSAEELARALGRGGDGPEWERLGFATLVGTRHVNAILASYVMPGTIVYTLSARTGDIRSYGHGRIMSSTVEGEVCS